MLIGLVGKPSCGKTTFFNAATESSAKVAPYPFTTIKPNLGTTWVRVPCPHKEIGRPCNPRAGFCLEGNRFVPVEIIDVAGLVPGAHAGRGLGNQFLDDIRQADVIIQIVDASGTTDLEGNPASYDPERAIEEVKMLENELLAWIEEKVKKAWEKARKIPGAERDKKLLTHFTGLGISEVDSKEILDKIGYPEDEEKQKEWARALLSKKPRIIAANKADVSGAEEIVKLLQKNFENVVPTSALAEYVLRRALRAGKIRYIPGDKDFEVIGELTEDQKRGLEYVRNVLETWGSTGVQEVINRAVLDLGKNIVVFPVEDENKWTDSKGNVLPDALIMPQGSTALDLAFAVHTEIGKKFIAAVDARTKRRLGKEYQLKHLDVVKIIAGR